MALRELSIGDSLAGVLVDGMEDTPFVVATLTYTETRGVRIEVPYIYRAQTEQFRSAETWFDTGTPPNNLAFLTKGGTLSLFGCQYSGHSMNIGQGYSMGIIAPDEVVLKGRDGTFADPLAVTQCKSEIDGLSEWTGFKAVDHERFTDGHGRIQKVVVTAKSVEGLSWRQGDATMTLSTTWSTSKSSPGFQISERVTLESSFSAPRAFADHLAEQRKVLSLLTLMFGRPVHFRRHEIRDDRFPDKTLSGGGIGKSFHELISRRTVREFSQPRPTVKELGRPLAFMVQVGVSGLTQWNQNYQDWKRFIEPTVSALRTSGGVLENIVVNASMSLEAAGNLLGPVSGEEETLNRAGRPTIATHVFRSIASLDLDWSKVSESVVGLSRAIAKNYNTIKHYDRGEFPDPSQTYVVSMVATTVVRLLALRLLDPSGQLVREYGKTSDFASLAEVFEQQDLFVEDSGAFTGYPEQAE